MSKLCSSGDHRDESSTTGSCAGDTSWVYSSNTSSSFGCTNQSFSCTNQSFGCSGHNPNHIPNHHDNHNPPPQNTKTLTPKFNHIIVVPDPQESSSLPSALPHCCHDSPSTASTRGSFQLPPPEVFQNQSSSSRRSMLPPIHAENLLATSPYPIHSSYIVKDKIGQGSWGSVHIVVERSSGLERAVKKIPKRFTTEIARFRQEITFLKALDHPNVVRVYECFEDYANIFMVMEYCRGGELFDRIVRAKDFNEATAAVVIYQILSSVCYIHRKNIAHRDLKPENFMFLTNDERSPMKLVDFGLAKRFNSRRRMRTKVGTLYYVAPEILNGSYDEKCDIWSAGVIMYLLLCGFPPFNGATDAAIIHQIAASDVQYPEANWSGVTPQARDLIKLLLHRDTQKRPLAHEALSHPWFTLFSPSLSTNLRLPRTRSIPGLQRFSGMSTGTSFGTLLGTSSGTSFEEGRTETRCQMDNPENRRYIESLGDEPVFSITADALLPNSVPVYHPHFYVPACCGLPIVCVHASRCPKAALVSAVTTVGSVTSEVLPDNLDAAPSVDATCCSTPTTLAECGLLQGCDTNSSTRVGTMTSKPLSESCRYLRVFNNLVKLMVPKWKHFATHNHLKRAALRVVAHQLYDGDQIQHLRTLFLVLDSKHEGGLSAEGLAVGRNVLIDITTFDSTRPTMGSSLVSPMEDDGQTTTSMNDSPTLTGSPDSRAQSPHVQDVSSASCLQNTLTSGIRSARFPQRSSQLLSSSLALLQSPHSPSTVSPSPFSSASVSAAAIPVCKDYSHCDYSECAGSAGASTTTAVASLITPTVDEVNKDDLYDDDESVLDTEELREVIKEVALDGGDVMDFSDFLAATMEPVFYHNENLLRAAFRVFDRNGDGWISAKDLGLTLGWLGPLCTTNTSFSPPGAYFSQTGVCLDRLELIVDEEIQRTLKICDVDGDGIVSFEDFAHILKHDNEIVPPTLSDSGSPIVNN